MIQTQYLLTGLGALAGIYAAFAIAFFLNAALGLYINVFRNLEKFEGRRLAFTFLNLVFVAVVMFGVALAFNLLAENAGFYDLNEQVATFTSHLVSIGMFALLFVKGFFGAVTDIYDKVRGLFEIQDDTVFDKDLVAHMRITRNDETNPDLVNHEVDEGGLG